MAHKLNTNKQFMIGNGILAFAVIFVVVIFIFLSLRMQRDGDGPRHYPEVYTITLERGFAGDSTAVWLNDSLLWNRVAGEEPVVIEVGRFSKENALMIVDQRTERLSLFELSERGGSYRFEKEQGEVKLLPMKQ